MASCHKTVVHSADVMAWMYAEILVITVVVRLFDGLSAGICDVCKCTNTRIDCSSQGLIRVPQDIPSNTTFLSLRGNSISTINSNAFANLTQLRYLDIGGNGQSAGQGNEINEDAFVDLDMLEHLFMDECNYLQFPKSLFSHFRNLQTLVLRGNHDLGLKTAVDSLKLMKNQSLQFLDLSYLNGKQNYEYAILDNTFFQSISHLSVKALRVEDNGILILVSGFWKIIPQIQLLSLARNKLIGKRQCIIELPLLTELKVLDLSEQSWSEYPDYSKTSLQYRNYNGDLNTASNKFSSDIEYTTRKSIDYCSITILLPQKLEVVLLNKFPGRNPISIDGYCFNKENSIKYMDVSYISISEIVTPIQGLIHLEYLNMQSCFIQHMHPNMFSDMTNLRILLLGKNFLFHSIENDKDCLLFRENRKLGTLDLARNSIENIPALYFRELHNVQHINLSMNVIADFQGAWFMNLTELVHINISYNRIPFLSHEAMKVLEELRRGKGKELSIDLTGNPLSCACGESIPFLRWMNTTRVHFFNKDSYMCKHQNKSTVYVKDVNVDTLEYECQVKKERAALPMIIGLVVSLVLVLTLVSSLGYRYRWRLRYFLYITCRFWRKYEELVDDADYEYDAFVAYNRGDVEWVVNSLLPNLEDRAGFKLCIHDRDFLVGNVIEETIVESIEHSRKTILVLSQHFLQSNWCYFEMQMARNRLFMRGCDCLIPLLMEDIPLETLGRSSTLRNLLETRTYLKWTENPEGQDLFWKHLHMALEMPDQPLVVN